MEKVKKSRPEINKLPYCKHIVIFKKCPLLLLKYGSDDEANTKRERCWKGASLWGYPLDCFGWLVTKSKIGLCYWKVRRTYTGLQTIMGIDLGIDLKKVFISIWFICMVQCPPSHQKLVQSSAIKYSNPCKTKCLRGFFVFCGIVTFYAIQLFWVYIWV